MRFPDTDDPDYWDFVYFSFVIGTSTAVSDVAITSRTIRRTRRPMASWRSSST
jgi:uncharacterized membrane protein